MKGVEIEALLNSMNPLCEIAEEVQAHEMQMKGDHLHDTWQRLRRLLAERVDLMQTYVRIHAMALQVSEAWNELENKLKDIPDSKEDQFIKEVEELWLSGNQKYIQLSHIGRNFMVDALKVKIRRCILFYCIYQFVHRIFTNWSNDGLGELEYNGWTG